jgi:hypothetical protein
MPEHEHFSGLLGGFRLLRSRRNTNQVPKELSLISGGEALGVRRPFPSCWELCDTWERRRPGGIQAGETPALPGSSSLGRFSLLILTPVLMLRD